MAEPRILLTCSGCGTEWYCGAFQYVECPKCHADSSKATSAFDKSDDTPVPYLCGACGTVWQQPANMKYDCPSCGPVVKLVAKF